MQTNWLSTFALTRKLSDSWSVIGRNVYLSSHASGIDAAGGHQDEAERESELLKKIGELTVERDFLARGLGRLQ